LAIRAWAFAFEGGTSSVASMKDAKLGRAPTRSDKISSYLRAELSAAAGLGWCGLVAGSLVDNVGKGLLAAGGTVGCLRAGIGAVVAGCGAGLGVIDIKDQSSSVRVGAAALVCIDGSDLAGTATEKTHH